MSGVDPTPEAFTALLVEDNAADARLFREVLRDVRRPAIELLHVARLEEALDCLKRGGIDVVLLDLSLPDAHGHETVVRATRAAPTMPIVVLTGLDDDELALEAVKAGAQDYLVKGQVDGPLLARAIRYAIERKRADEDRRRFAGEQAARREAQAAEVRWRFLADVSDVLASSVDYRATLRDAARLLVTVLAERCTIEVLEDQVLRCVASSCRSESGPLAGSAEELLQIPLVARGRELGRVTFARSASEPPWTPEDRRVAADFARRAALAVDNARLYKAREDVLGVVSHDLRNPLNVISLALGMLERPELPEPIVARQLAAVRRAVEQMKTLVSDLLDATRLEADGLPMTRATLATAALLRDTCDALRTLAEQRGVTLRPAPADDLPPLLADRDRLLQVLCNLAGNAIKFSPPGGVVTVAADADRAGVRFEVRDQGPGIAPEDLPHVFDRFWQGGRDRRHGAGLGLAIARRIVQGHGGTIGVDSRPGEGSTFHFTLPLQGH